MLKISRESEINLINVLIDNDVISGKDLINIKKTTNYVVGLPKEHGGLGDSSAPTAFGVYIGMKSAMLNITGSESLEGKKILVLGVGKVGSNLTFLIDL